MDKVRVTVTLGDKEVTINGPEDFVRAEVQRLTNLVLSSVSVPISTDAAELRSSNSERGFISLKSPEGHAQIVAVLAYYLAQAGQQEFTAEDVRRAYARAGVRPPKVIAQSLRDAKNVHDYLEKGSGRGTFRLSPHGARTVEFDLPRKDGA